MTGELGIIRWVGVLALLASSSVPVFACDMLPVIWVDTNANSGGLVLTLMGRSEGACQGRYEFAVKRSGAAGRSANKQAGNFSVGPDAGTVVAKSSINVGPHDTWSAEAVVLFEDGQYVKYSVGKNGP